MIVNEFLTASVIDCEKYSSIWPVYPDGIACKICNDAAYLIPNKITYVDDKSSTIWTMFAYRNGVCALRSPPNRNEFSVIISENRGGRSTTSCCLLGCNVIMPCRSLGSGIGVFVSEKGLFILEPARIRVIDSVESEVERIPLPFRLTDDVYHRFVVFDNRAFIETSEGVIVFDIVNNSYKELEYGTKLSDDMSAVISTKSAGPSRKLQFLDLRSFSITAETFVPFAGVTHINYNLGCVVFWSCGDIHIVDFRKNSLAILCNVGNFAVNKDGYVVFSNTSIPKTFLCHISDILELTQNSRNVLVIDTDVVYDDRTMLVVLDTGA